MTEAADIDNIAAWPFSRRGIPPPKNQRSRNLRRLRGLFLRQLFIDTQSDFLSGGNLKPISRGYLRSLRLTTLSALILTSFIQLANGQNSRENRGDASGAPQGSEQKKESALPIPPESKSKPGTTGQPVPRTVTTRRPPAICCSTTSTINRSAASSMSPIPKTASRPNPAPSRSFTTAAPALPACGCTWAPSVPSAL